MADERSLGSEYSPTVAVADNSPNGTLTHEVEPADAADATAAEASAAEVDAEAEALAETAATSDEAASAEGSTPDFLTRLAQAMRTTVTDERTRIADDIELRRAAQLAVIEGRRDFDAKRMRDLAEDDRRAIDNWAEAESRRIEAERGRRTTELEADLSRSIAEHNRQINAQIQSVEAAIARHRSDVQAFFGSLEGETDPVRIAQLAGTRPTFPDLEMAATATSVASSEPAAAEAAVVAIESEPEPVADASVEPEAVATDAEATAAGTVEAGTEPIEKAADAQAEPVAADATTQEPPTPAESNATVSAPAASDAEPERIAVMDPIARLGLQRPAPPDFGKERYGSSNPSTSAEASASTPDVLMPIGARAIGRSDEPVRQTHSGPTSGVMGWLRRINEPDDH